MLLYHRSIIVTDCINYSKIHPLVRVFRSNIHTGEAVLPHQNPFVPDVPKPLKNKQGTRENIVSQVLDVITFTLSVAIYRNGPS